MYRRLACFYFLSDMYAPIYLGSHRMYRAGFVFFTIFKGICGFYLLSFFVFFFWEFSYTKIPLSEGNKLSAKPYSVRYRSSAYVVVATIFFPNRHIILYWLRTCQFDYTTTPSNLGALSLVSFPPSSYRLF